MHREWTVHCALCIVHCALGIALCTVLCAFCIVHCALCIVRCAVGSHFGSMPGCTRVHVHCAFGIVHCASFIVRCAVCGNSVKTVPPLWPTWTSLSRSWCILSAAGAKTYACDTYAMVDRECVSGVDQEFVAGVTLARRPAGWGSEQPAASGQ